MATTLESTVGLRRPLEPLSVDEIAGRKHAALCARGFERPEAGGFAARHPWVTPFDERQRFAAGDYPNQHAGRAGLPAYTKDNHPIVDTDVVVWYMFGAHHVVRPEDWPIMPVAKLGFSLKPVGFFDRNPGLDVPPSMTHGTVCHDSYGA